MTPSDLLARYQWFWWWWAVILAVASGLWRLEHGQLIYPWLVG